MHSGSFMEETTAGAMKQYLKVSLNEEAVIAER